MRARPNCSPTRIASTCSSTATGARGVDERHPPNADISNNTALRTQKVNGPLYAFDRGTGKRLWYYGNGLFENQVASAGAVRRDAGASWPRRRCSRGRTITQNIYPVVVIEKARGRLVFDKPRAVQQSVLPEPER